MKRCSLILMAFMFIFSLPAKASISEVFEDSDIHTTRADIAKFFLTRGAQISHGEAYNSNTLQAVERIMEQRNIVTRNFVFQLTEVENGTRVDMQMYKTIAGSKTNPASSVEEKEMINQIITSSKGKFLYGLGFDFQTYNTEKGKVKAPKGKETGIKLTAVRYDALAKGLMVGDVIVEINGTPVNKMPMEEYRTVLFAKSPADKVTLTVKRGEIEKTVTLTPRVSTRKVF